MFPSPNRVSTRSKHDAISFIEMLVFIVAFDLKVVSCAKISLFLILRTSYKSLSLLNHREVAAKELDKAEKNNERTF